MFDQAKISINFVESLTSSQSRALKKLQKICFSEVTDGMIAPLGSPEVYAKVLRGQEALYVGDGYW